MLPLPGKPVFNPAAPAQYWINAAECFNALRALAAPVPMTIGVLANFDMEAAFKASAVGDKGTAFNFEQWHWAPRGENILTHTGIDVRTERSIAKIVFASWWELHNVRAYAPALAELLAATHCADAARTFCRYIEGAGAQDAADRRVLDAVLLSVWVDEHADFIASYPATPA
jgi:hypothetical protein